MDKIEVWPEHPAPSHHVSLSDGEKSIGLMLINDKGASDPLAMTGNPTDRTPLKFSEGATKYSDMVYPWSTVAQESWTNGRGFAEFEKDQSRYYDSKKAYTIDGTIIPAGLETYLSKGLRNYNAKDIGSVKWISVIEESAYLAQEFTPSANYSIVNIYLLIRRIGTPETAITIDLCSDSGGAPDAVLKTATIDTTDITDILAEFYKSTITAQALTSGTKYWIKISSDGTQDDHWKIGASGTAGTSLKSEDGSAWLAADYDLYYRCTDADQPTYRKKLFSYRNQPYLVLNKGYATAPEVYVNGDFGVADANTGALGTLVDATKTWTVDEFIDSYAWIIQGPGSQEEKPWRKITANTATTLTLDESWIIEHTTATVYIIVGGPAKWRQLTAANGYADIAFDAVPVTNVSVISDFLYFCQGDDNPIVRFQWYQNAGALTFRQADDSTNKAVQLTEVLDNTSGRLVWKANNKDASSNISVASVAAPTSWANMSFAAAVTVPPETGRIKFIKEYSESGVKQLWIMTEGMVYRINSGKLDAMPLEELKTFMFYRNAESVITHNVYLVFPWGKGGVERYYNLNLDDVGPNRNEGLPTDRQGYVSALEAHPGKYLVVVDAGDDGYSSVFFNTGTDFMHEIYRAPAAGERIMGAKTQVLPGEEPNRIWLDMGSDMIYLPIPKGTVNPKADPLYPYTYECMVESGWIQVGMPDVWKFWHEVKLWAENLEEDEDGTGGIDVEVQYKYDTETTWVSLTEKFNTVPSQGVKIMEKLGINAKRMKLRVIARTNDQYTPPEVKSVVIENAMRIQVKYAFSFRLRVQDNDVNYKGEQEDMTGEEKMEIIKSWMDNITPLYMRTLDQWSDESTIFLNPIPYQKNKKTKNSWILQAVAVQI